MRGEQPSGQAQEQEELLPLLQFRCEGKLSVLNEPPPPGTWCCCFCCVGKPKTEVIINFAFEMGSWGPEVWRPEFLAHAWVPDWMGGWLDG